MAVYPSPRYLLVAVGIPFGQTENGQSERYFGIGFDAISILIREGEESFVARYAQ